MKILGKLIRESRQAKGLLIRQVAAELNIDPSLLSRIERSDKRPTRAQVIQLTEILDAGDCEFLAIYLSERIISIVINEPVAIRAIALAKNRLDSPVTEGNFWLKKDVSIDLPPGARRY